METSEKVGRLLTDIRVKADQLMADEEEARNAGVSDGSLPSLDSDEGLEKVDTAQTEAWKQVKAQAWVEFEKTVLEEHKKYFQTLLRQSLINEWIKENLGMKGGMEFGQLRSTIEAHIAANRIPALKLYLNDVLNHGVVIADKNVKRRRAGGWAWLGYSVAVVKGLIYVAAVLAILNVAESRFEKVVLVLLILIGNAALGHTLHIHRLFVEIHEKLEMQFSQLRRFFRLPEEESERNTRQESRAEMDIQLVRQGIAYIIQIAFEGIVWLICAVELVLALLR